MDTKIEITTDEFRSYLKSLKLDFINSKETPYGYEAIVFGAIEPNLKDFTQVLRFDFERYWVRLSKKDMNNEKITKGYFKLERV